MNVIKHSKRGFHGIESAVLSAEQVLPIDHRGSHNDSQQSLDGDFFIQQLADCFRFHMAAVIFLSVRKDVNTAAVAHIRMSQALRAISLYFAKASFPFA